MKKRGRRGELHLVARPLHLVHNVKASMQEKRVQVPGFGTEAGNAVAALLRGAKLKLEERVVLCAYDAEVVRHVFRGMRDWGEVCNWVSMLKDYN